MVNALSHDNLRGKPLRLARNCISSPCIYRNDQDIFHCSEHSGEGMFQQVPHVTHLVQACPARIKSISSRKARTTRTILEVEQICSELLQLLRKQRETLDSATFLGTADWREYEERQA